MVRRVQRGQHKPRGHRGEGHHSIGRSPSGPAQAPVHRPGMQVEGAHNVGMIVVDRPAVEVKMIVIVCPFGEVVVIQWPDDRQRQRKQRGGQQEHPAQRGRLNCSGGPGNYYELLRASHGIIGEIEAEQTVAGRPRCSVCR